MIQTIPIHERPRERCITFGPHCLSLRECLAVILGSGPKKIGCMGLSQKILQSTREPYLPEEEMQAFFLLMESSSASASSFLSQISGLGEAGRARILASFELARRYHAFKMSKKKTPDVESESSKKTFRVPDFAKASLRKISFQQRQAPLEWIGFVPIYPLKKVGELCVVDRGSRTHVNTDPGEFFSKVLALKPTSIVLFHNHPSGLVHPSLEDLELTEKIAYLSGQLGITCLGHWIVSTQGEYFLSYPLSPS